MGFRIAPLSLHHDSYMPTFHNMQHSKPKKKYDIQILKFTKKLRTKMWCVKIDEQELLHKLNR
jgi:hypothetical protein